MLHGKVITWIIVCCFYSTASATLIVAWLSRCDLKSVNRGTKAEDAINLSPVQGTGLAMCCTLIRLDSFSGTHPTKRKLVYEYENIGVCSVYAQKLLPRSVSSFLNLTAGLNLQPVYALRITRQKFRTERCTHDFPRVGCLLHRAHHVWRRIARYNNR